MRKLTVFVTLLLPSIGFLLASRDAPALPALNNMSGLSVRFAEQNDGVPSALADTAGVTFRRRAVYWHEWESAGMNRYGPLFEHLDTMGFEILVVFSGTPADWQDTIPGLCPGDGRCPPSEHHLDKWNDFVSQVSDSFPHIDHYEVWNEPYQETSTTTGKSFFFGSVSQLVELTDRTMSNINAEDLVIGPGNLGSGANVVMTLEYLDSLDQRGIMVNKISAHVYADGGAANQRARFLRDTLAALGFTDGLWMTEVGWFNHTPSDLQQTDLIDSVYTLVRDSSWYEVANYWMWTEQPPDSQFGEDQRGIVELIGTTTQGVELEPYCRLVRFAGNLGLSGRCIDAEINPSSQTTVPENTSCTWSASPWDPDYSYVWYRDSQQVATTQEYTYMTPSAPDDFLLRVEITDDTGTEGGGWDVMGVTVASMGMCTI